MALPLAWAIAAATVIGVLAVAAGVEAWVDGRPPRAAALAALAAGLLAVAALRMAPAPLELADLPRAFATVIGTVID